MGNHPDKSKRGKYLGSSDDAWAELTRGRALWPMVVAFLIFLLMLAPLVINWSVFDPNYDPDRPGITRDQLKEQLLQESTKPRRRTVVGQ
jgi:hypothetical protein